MTFTEMCSIKINLNLRVLGLREDGYHEIHSLFWRKKSPEVLDITLSSEDKITVFGAEIPGENILSRTCRYLRSHCGDATLPPVDIKLYKHLPMGSGIGAGSGNAAAMLRWFARYTGRKLNINDTATLGADVAFLASDCNLATADGIGEILTGTDSKLDLTAVILFPSWTVNTAKAYAEIDKIRCYNKSKCDNIRKDKKEQAAKESFEILNSLKSGRSVGLLPNDFIDCLRDYSTYYENIYTSADRAGALAWGLCGSGSASFALFGNSSQDAVAEFFHRISKDCGGLLSSLNKTLVLE